MGWIRLWSRPFAGEHIIRLGLVQVIGNGRLSGF